MVSLRVRFQHTNLIKQVNAALGGCNRTSWALGPPAELVKGTHNLDSWLNEAPSEPIADEACPAIAKDSMRALRTETWEILWCHNATSLVATP